MVPGVQIGQLICPKGDGTGTVAVNVAEIQHLESRMAEVATVNTLKAPELMTAMNRGFLETGRVVVLVEHLLSQAQKAVADRKAVLLLDIVPGVLAEKGYTAARAGEDLRSAIIQQDAEWAAASDRVAQLKALVALMKLKQKGFENAYTSTKKVYGGGNAMPGPNFNNAPERTW